jgi:hypothetical protein
MRQNIESRVYNARFLAGGVSGPHRPLDFPERFVCGAAQGFFEVPDSVVLSPKAAPPFEKAAGR